MPTVIRGLHHITSLASSARANNAFYTDTLGLRRVKKTVNFDAPHVYHLYFGDEAGTPGSVTTSFPFPGAARGSPGTGEVGATAFSVPPGSLPRWTDRLTRTGLELTRRFGEARLTFQGPDGEALALIEAEDGRAPWTGGGVARDMAIRGFHSALLRVGESDALTGLLHLMGYEVMASDGPVTRFRLPEGNGATVLDVETAPDAPPARQGAGSVHHIAFAVADRPRQDQMRKALTEAGFAATPPIDRSYFWSVYFRSPGGILFEIATNEPGFARDEDPARLGTALKLPPQHEPLRDELERTLPPLS